MTRGEGWRFLDMGRKLERSLHIIAAAAGDARHPGRARGAGARRGAGGGGQRDDVPPPVPEQPARRGGAGPGRGRRDEPAVARHAARRAGGRRGPPAAAGDGRGGRRSSGSRWPRSGRCGWPNRSGSRWWTRAPARRSHDLLAHVGGWLPILSDAITQQYLCHLQTSQHLATPDTIRRTAADSGDGL